MTRRAILFALAAASAAAADPTRETWDLLTKLANALAEGDAPSFLYAFDHGMPGYQDFSLAVTGLLNEVTINSSISPIQNSGNNQRREMEVDWSMHLVNQNDVGEVAVREANVKLGLERRRGKWKVISFEPANFFRAPSGIAP